MRLIKFLKTLSVTAATFGLLLPHAVIANASENVTARRQAEVVRDLALGAGGLLQGQVVNRDGLPERGATVSLLRDGETVATVKTDAEGTFAINGISGGVFAITSGKAIGIVRAWTPGTAPPAASRGVLLVPTDLTARGQSCLAHLTPAQIGVGGLIVLGMAGAIIAVAVNDSAS